nr:hypothetical protein [Criblamydia sequanensis]
MKPTEANTILSMVFEDRCVMDYRMLSSLALQVHRSNYPTKIPYAVFGDNIDTYDIQQAVEDARTKCFKKGFYFSRGFI